jgi:hypothetical protein
VRRIERATESEREKEKEREREGEGERKREIERKRAHTSSFLARGTHHTKRQKEVHSYITLDCMQKREKEKNEMVLA